MLFAPAVKRVFLVSVGVGLLTTLSSCSSGFDIGGCTPPDDIRRGTCTPVDVEPSDHFDKGLSCMAAIVSTAYWPGELIATGHVDVAAIPDYDADAELQRWHCRTPENTY